MISQVLPIAVLGRSATHGAEGGAAEANAIANYTDALPKQRSKRSLEFRVDANALHLRIRLQANPAISY